MIRDAQQIQRAHDILIEVVTGRVAIDAGEGSVPLWSLHAALDVLCWALQHDHNSAFAENLAKVERLIKQSGYELIDTGKLQTRSSL